MGRFHANLFGASGQEEEDQDEQQEEQDDVMQPYYANTYGERPPRRIYGIVIQSPQQNGDDDDDHRNHTNGGRNFWFQQTHQWPDDEETSNQNENGPPRRSRFFWYWVVGIVIVAHLLTRYGPPAPPPLSSDEEVHHEWTSWSEFLSVEGSRLLSSVTSLSSILPYALKWCVVGVQDDVNRLVNDARQWHYEWQEERQRRQRPICDLVPLPSLQDDDEDVVESVESFFRRTIVGQEQAISAVAEALDAWDIMEETPDAISTTTRPLLLLLTGTPGVGKLELARQVTQLVFGHCSQTSDNRDMQQHQHLHEGVLLLRGKDFSSDEHSRNEHQDEEDLMMTTRFLQDNLYRQIGHHVQRQGDAGAVVIIQHVEKMALELLTTLCRDLTASAATTLSYPKDIIRHPGSLHAASYPDEMIETKLEKVIFIFTTNVGAGIIRQSIKHYGGIDDSPKLDLDLALRHELDAHFVGGEEHLEHDDKLVGSMVHAIAPFVPLGPSELELILHQKIEQLSLLKQRAGLWKRLVMTRAAATALVDTKHVDYIRWKERDSEEVILVFSPSGAKLLENGSPIMNRIKSQNKRCFSVLAHQPNRVAVLDYDARERMALFCWCNEEEESASSDYYMYMEDACESCEEICRFSLLG